VILKIVQTGEPVLRQKARQLSKDEIESAAIQQLIRLMRDTLQDAPGVGLAAPQVGLPLQLAVIEDRAEYHKEIPRERLCEREREPVPFQAIVNPVITSYGEPNVEFFEGCLSVAGFSALVPRSSWVRVEAVNERAEPLVIEARGWYARILQHEIDHLNGTMYLDRMRPRSFTTNVNVNRFWNNKTIDEIRAALDAT
jgi:peptide deformylase